MNAASFLNHQQPVADNDDDEHQRLSLRKRSLPNSDDETGNDCLGDEVIVDTSTTNQKSATEWEWNVARGCGVGASRPTTQHYTPRQGDRFQVFVDYTVEDVFGNPRAAAGWYTGTATDVFVCDDTKYLIYLHFDDYLTDDLFDFPAPDIQRIHPSHPSAADEVVAVDEGSDGAVLGGLAYEWCSPDLLVQVGDIVLICCKYQAANKAEGEWHWGRVAIVHENNETCDVVLDAGDHDCNVPKSRLRLMERGRDAKGWLVGLPIKLRDPSGKTSMRGKISRMDGNGRVVLTFTTNGRVLEVAHEYEQIAEAIMGSALQKAMAMTHH